MLSINPDAWSQGQVFSKLWLLEQLEAVSQDLLEPRIALLGGWYGLLPFMLFVRNQMHPRSVVSFDIDEVANQIALRINDSWSFNPRLFKAETTDCQTLDFKEREFDIIINTSCEHFSNQWSQQIPNDTLLALQSTDMPHAEHINPSKSLEDFKSQFPLIKEFYYAGQKDFEYPTLKFSRFMIIGRT